MATVTPLDVLPADAPVRQHTDLITGLPGRDSLEQHLGLVVRRGAPVGVFFVDLDRFHLVNEGFGHDAGDEVLRAVADRLTTILRPGDFLARFGVDTFAVVCCDLAGEREAIAIAQRTIALFREPATTSAGTFSLGVSIGVTLTSEGACSTPSDLLREADIAMHQVKQRGGRGYSMFDATMFRRVLHLVELERELRRALAHGELRLNYQPVVIAATGEIVNFEALMRWEHPTRGILPPSEFIQAAERSGLIIELGEWALRAACRQIAAWTPQAPGPEWAKVAVNVSAVQIAHPGFVAQVRQALAETGIEPRRLAIELTETALIEEATVAMEVIEDLKALGIRVILDDFGTGYSSLGYLARFPVDAIKLDRSFISGEQAERSGPIVEAVAGMARSLGLHLVGEGVETQEQAEMLLGLGCTFAQGYFYARPMPGEQVAAWASVARRNQRPLPAPAADCAGDLMGLGDAANALGVSPSTLRRWADDGRVPTRRTDGGHRRFLLGDLKRLSTTANVQPRLRTGPGLTEPVPQLAALLATESVVLTDTAGRGLYEGHARGWFACERARPVLHEWVGRVASAARTGSLEEALQATTALTRTAEASGAALVEISMFLERFAALTMTAARTHQSADEQAQTQRLFRHVRRQPLTGR